MDHKCLDHGYHLVNAAVTLPVGGKYLPLFASPCSSGPRRMAGKASISVILSLFPKKNDARPKSFFPRAVIPFRGRKQPDGSDLIVNGKGLS
jgi:hypothetical protein